MSAAHKCSCLAKNSREGVDELYHWAEAIDELPILVTIIFERFRVLFQKKEDGIGRVTVLDLVSERIVL